MKMTKFVTNIPKVLATVPKEDIGPLKKLRFTPEHGEKPKSPSL